MLQCHDCSASQTERNFKTRFKEHKSDFRHDRHKSNFARHLIDNGHASMGIDDTLKILKINKSNSTANCNPGDDGSTMRSVGDRGKLY